MTRVLIQQVLLPHYRVPVLNALAARDGLQVCVAFDHWLPENQSAATDFELLQVRARRWWPNSVLALNWQSVPLETGTERPDVLLMEWSLRSLTMFSLLARARALRIPTVLWGHGFSKREHPAKHRLRLQVARLADAVLFYDETTRARHVTAGLSAERSFVAANTLDITPMQRARAALSPQELERFKEQQRLGGKRLLLFVARLNADRGLSELLLALRELPADVVLAVVGDGEKLGGSVTRAEMLGVSQRVRFVGSCYEEAQLARWFLSAYALCVPSCLGLGLLHAFSYGLPVVASAEAAGPEIEALEHEVNGLRVDDSRAAQMVPALRRLLDDRALRDQLAAAAERTVTERSVKRMVDGIEAAIRFAANR